MRTSISPCLVLLFLLPVVGPAASADGDVPPEPPAAAAEAVSDPAFVHDFGSVIEGDKPEHAFTFTNTTDAPLNIRNVRVPCGCAKVGVAKNDLAPGESTAFTVTFASKGLRGRVAKHVYVLTDAPGLAMVKYTMQATVEPRPAPRCVVSGSLRLGALKVNQVADAVVAVENRGSLDLTVAPGAVPRNIVLAGDFPVVVKPGEKAEIKLSYTAPFHAGRQRGNLQLLTNDPLRPKVWIIVLADIEKAEAAEQKAEAREPAGSEGNPEG